MADYFSVLRRAIDSLRPNTEETRRVLYERAKATLIAQLQGLDPPATPEQIDEQGKQLASAIARIEADIAAAPAVNAPQPTPQAMPSAPSTPSPAALPPTVSTPLPPAPEPVAPTPRPFAPTPGFANSPEASSPAHPVAPSVDPPASPGPATGGPQVRLTDPSPPGPKPAAGMGPLLERPADDGARLGGRDRPEPAMPRVDRPAPDTDLSPRTPELEPGPSIRQDQAAASATPQPVAAQSPQPLPGSDYAPSAGPSLASELPADGFVDDPFIEDLGAAHRPKGRWLAPLILVLLLGAVGATGYVFRAPLLDWANNLAEVVETGGEDEGEKVEDRVGESEAAGETGDSEASVDQAETPETPSAEAGDVIGRIAEAQLIEQNDEDPNDPVRTPGSVRWYTETENGETVLIGLVDVPSRGLSMSMTFRNNTDPTFPATHTVTFQFSLTPTFGSGGIQDVPRLLLKQTAQSPGTPLVTDVIQVDEGVFLMALSGVDQDAERNIRELRARPFLDVPLVYADERLAILTLAKGSDGDEAFVDAFNAWSQ